MVSCFYLFWNCLQSSTVCIRDLGKCKLVMVVLLKASANFDNDRVTRKMLLTLKMLKSGTKKSSPCINKGSV